MNVINLSKDLNTVESKVNLKDKTKDHSDETNNFQKYLEKSNNKEVSTLNKKTQNNEENKNKEDLDDSLQKASEKIETIIQKVNKAAENDEEINLSEDISEVILLLLNYLNNPDNKNLDNKNLDEINEANFNNINLENISNISLCEMLNSNSKENILTSLNNINSLIKDNLNTIDSENINSLLNLMEKDSLDEELLKDISSIMDKLLNSNKDLEKVDTKDSLYLNSKANIENLSNLENNNTLELSKEISENNLKNNNSETNEDKFLSKEDEFLEKILNEDLTNNTTNYYSKLSQNNILNGIEGLNEPTAISKENMTSDIIKNIKYMVMDSIKELSVKIYPKELGELTIKILSEEGAMKAELKATSKETYNLLNANINDIKKSLENQNIKIQEVNIGIYNEDTTFFSGKENQNQNSRYFNEEINASYSYDEDEIIEEINLENNINYLA